MPTSTLETENPVAQAEHDVVARLLASMTLAEKIGQLQQVDASCEPISEELRVAIAAGRIGAVINRSDPQSCNALQKIAVTESRLGIPLLIGRDVIHGFRSIAPIPIGQAASWNCDLVRKAARVAALEARSQGVNWTFSPMIDIARDPRWGRIAESFGEDPFLTAKLGVAMIKGYQTDHLLNPGAIASCAKHFVGYGASESGRDYNTTNIPTNELRNIYLQPFRQAVEAGVATLMTSFSDLDGVPATANKPLIDGVLRNDWGFDGLVVSDWNAIKELIEHGLSAGPRDAAMEAALAGVDMEMAGDAYASHLESLITAGLVPVHKIDAMVERVLRLKDSLGLFEQPYVDPQHFPPLLSPEALQICYQMAVESFVLLKNDASILPLNAETLKSVAVIGPLADAPHEQMGTWVFDGQATDTVTPLQALRDRFADKATIHFAPGLANSRDRKTALFDEAERVVRDSDVALVFLGEESILSGEAHSRADIRLPGAQSLLLERLKALGKPVITVILAGRPLVLGQDLPNTDALIFGWHPGTMGGPAIVDVLFGDQCPCGKLPVTFPKSVGQVPIYYNHKNTGRPPIPAEIVLIDDIAVGAKQTSLGMSAFYLDDGYQPLFPFGFGLSYGTFELSDLWLSHSGLPADGTLTLQARITNIGNRRGTETVQLYIRDRAASLTRPVRELKAYQRYNLSPGETATVRFSLTADDLSFYRRDGTFGPEPGSFLLWVATHSANGLEGTFELLSA